MEVNSRKNSSLKDPNTNDYLELDVWFPEHKLGFELQVHRERERGRERERREGERERGRERERREGERERGRGEREKKEGRGRRWDL